VREESHFHHIPGALVVRPLAFPIINEMTHLVGKILQMRRGQLVKLPRPLRKGLAGS